MADDASAALTRMVGDAEEALASPTASVRRAKAEELQRGLTTLLPRLTSEVDRGWALVYRGTARAILGDVSQACADLRAARAVKVTTPSLTSNAEQLQRKLRCSR